MGLILRLALTLVLVATAAFCCFGFGASFETGPWWFLVFRWVYGSVVIACIAAIVAVWVVKAKGRQP